MHKFLCSIAFLLIIASTATAGVTHKGITKLWHPQYFTFEGDTTLIGETDVSPNPFVDRRGEMVFTNGGTTVTVPAHFIGDGRGSPKGKVWEVIWNPEKDGTWNYTVHMESGTDIAIETVYGNGTQIADDGVTGSITIDTGLDSSAPGFLGKGRLIDTGIGHYLRHESDFGTGDYFVKMGIDSPENLFAFWEFDNTEDQGGGDFGLGDNNSGPTTQEGLHRYDFNWDGTDSTLTHAQADWETGDPWWGLSSDKKGKGLIGFVNYLGDVNLNSMYFLPMNLGGDGQDTYPFIDGTTNAPSATLQYDISKLAQWEIVLNHAQEQGILVQFVLSETEGPNENWLDDNSGPTVGIERKVFFREMISRFGFLNGIKWNLGEEMDFNTTTRSQMFAYFAATDPYSHPIAIHSHGLSPAQTSYSQWDNHDDDEDELTAICIQARRDDAGYHVRHWRERSAAKYPWIIDFDEDNADSDEGLAANGTGSWDPDETRKRLLWDVIINGGGIEFYLGYHDPSGGSDNEGGDMTLEDLRTRSDMWDYTDHCRAFFTDRLFERFIPDKLLLNQDQFNAGECTARIALPIEKYMIYLMDGKNGGGYACTLEVQQTDEEYKVEFFNPRTGVLSSPEYDQSTTGSPPTIQIGAPPSDQDNDWAIYVEIND